ncbi:TIGR01244 family sulfur transferase [Glaciecola sp. SC05]|uniref:TIGR01244 family sulfur transferase n=1 Tax=Glaciecola sp. SC05 TaxID=1987355 RepID=UPI0035270C50
MSIAQITPTFSVSGALTEAEFQALAVRGIDTLINVRPDGESAEQINSAQWHDLAKLHKMQYRFMPVKPCEYSAQDIANFAVFLKQSHTSAHGFCRTGTRAIHLWALANKDTLSFDYMQDLAKQAGYDLNMIADRFKA